MKRIATIIFCLFLAANGGFVEGLEDLPLPEKWQQLDGETISFGNKDTNFVQITLESKTESVNDLISFYKTTLPQLGWVFNGAEKKPISFSREKELLLIENIQKNARITYKMTN